VLLVQTDGTDPQAADRLRRVPGVESVATSGWSLLSGNTWTSTVRFAGKAPDSRPQYFLDVSPGFLETMRIGLVEGRDFRAGDAPPKMTDDKRAIMGVGIVNETFARKFFEGRSPVGRVVDVGIGGKDLSVPLEIIGLMRDTPYRNLREPIRPTVFVPLDENKRTLLVRTAGNPLSVAPLLRQELAQDGKFRVPTIDTHTAIVRRHMIRERLLATLSLFFAIVALVLAGVGLYGVLNYSVVQQRREIGIRIALGARMTHVVQRVTASLFAMVALGCAAGIASGLVCARFVETLLYEVKPTDVSSLSLPIVVLVTAAVLAAIPPVLRAARIDPAQTLRSE
jgi:putative ABC transport system permease protein